MKFMDLWNADMSFFHEEKEDPVCYNKKIPAKSR